MPNKKGGKKFKKGKKQGFAEKQLIYKDPKEDQEYGRIINACGNGRFQVYCFDGKERLGVIAGRMRKRVWVNRLDLVLIEPWTFQNEANKCSILHKYEDNEKSKLLKGGHLPKEFKLEEDNINLDEDNYFSYDISDSDDEKESSSDERVNENNVSSEEEIDLDDI